MDHLVSLMKTTRQGLTKLRRLKEREDLIYIDDITGLYNRRKLEKDMEDTISRSKAFGEKFFLLFIDIDFFKQINDSYGHLAGTQLLKKVALVLQNILRESDSVYRYCGDEFIMMISGIDSLMAKNMGERVLQAVSGANFKIKGDEIKLSVSIGISAFPRDAQTTKELLDTADKMMYEVKKTERGKVFSSSDILRRPELTRT